MTAVHPQEPGLEARRTTGDTFLTFPAQDTHQGFKAGAGVHAEPPRERPEVARNKLPRTTLQVSEPFLDAGAARGSRRVRQRANVVKRTELVLQDMFDGLHFLESGGDPALEKPQPGCEWRGGVIAEKERERLRELAHDHVEHVRPFITYGTPEMEEAAWVRLAHSGSPAYGGGLERGAVVPMLLDKLDLPDRGDTGGMLVEVAMPEVKNWESWMLKEELPTEKELAEVKSYGDPSLASARRLAQLAARLWKAGLVRPVKRKTTVGAEFFAVSKERRTTTTAQGEVRQRLIADMRRPAHQFVDPPKAHLGSPRALGFLDLSDSVLGDDEIWLFTGDVPCFFYNLLMPDSWAAWNVMEGLDYSMAAEMCKSLGGKNDEFFGEDFDAFGFTALPMGHKWSPYIAEKCLEFVLDQAGLGAEGRMLHGKPAPELRSGPVNMPYLDDYLGIVRGGSARSAGEAATRNSASCKGALREHGLGCHKEEEGQRVTSLGMSVDVRKGARVVRPSPEAFAELLLATRALARKRRALPRDVSRLVGRWAWWISLRSEVYSVLNATYWFVQRTSFWAERYEDIPSAVRRELEALLQLAPFLRADLGWETSSTVYATDACLSGGGVVYRKVDEAPRPEGEGVASGPGSSMADVRSLCRSTCSWEGTVEAGEELRELCGVVDGVLQPEQNWKTAISTKWKRQNKIDYLEGEAAILSLRHRLRSTVNRKQRILQLQDNQAILGTLRKGRSSAPRLLVQARRVAALCLFGELRAAWVYVPSAWNRADEPSRRFEPYSTRGFVRVGSSMPRPNAAGCGVGRPAPPFVHGPATTEVGSLGAFLPDASAQIRLGSGTAVAGQRSDKAVRVEASVAASSVPVAIATVHATPLGPTAPPAERGKRARARTQRAARDEFAWSLPHAPESPLDADGRPLRLAVAEATDSIYRTRMQTLAEWANARWGGGGSLHSTADFDSLVLSVCDAYVHGRERGGKAAPGQLMSAVLHAYPAWAGSLPLTARFVKRVVAKVKPPVERKGLPWELVLLAACRARERKWEQTAIKIVVMFDCLLRGEDVEQLRVRQVVLAPDGRVVLRLGDALDDATAAQSAQHRTKTGFDAGVIVERTFVADAVRDLVHGRDGTQFVFTQDRAEFEAQFRELFRELGVEAVPHQLRHGGASQMVIDKKSLWDVQVRGRWDSKTSVKRYAKPWAALIAWDQISRTVYAEAKECAAQGGGPAWTVSRPTQRMLF